MYRGKRLYRSQEDRMIAGVCGGLGEYFEVDPTLIRILWILFSIAGGAGILAYIAAYIIIPERRAIPEIYSSGKRCINCGKMNDESALYCRHCGQKQETPEKV